MAIDLNGQIVTNKDSLKNYLQQKSQSNYLNSGFLKNYYPNALEGNIYNAAAHSGYDGSPSLKMELNEGSKVPDSYKYLKSHSLKENEGEVKEYLMANGIYDRYNMDWLNKFSRFGVIDPYNTLTGSKEYVFFTKPDLCLMDTSATSVSDVLSNNPFFVDAINRYKPVAAQLQSSINPANPFMAILSNSIISSISLPGLSSNSIDTSANVMGTKITYRGTSYQSDEDFTFDTEFEDNKFLDVYMLFKMYDEYEKLKWNGDLNFNQSKTARWVNYTLNKILHDQITIYKFIVDDTGSRIIYWARITGCYPTSVPRDAFSDLNSGEPVKFSVSWKGHFVRDMDPIIINQFNQLVSPSVNGKTVLQLYNSEYQAMDGRWAAMPFIQTVTAKHNYRGSYKDYHLRWAI